MCERGPHGQKDDHRVIIAERTTRLKKRVGMTNSHVRNCSQVGPKIRNEIMNNTLASQEYS